eukprot:7384138-Prymnesium_polylepis.2
MSGGSFPATCKTRRAPTHALKLVDTREDAAQSARCGVTHRSNRLIARGRIELRPLGQFGNLFVNVRDALRQ